MSKKAKIEAKPTPLTFVQIAQLEATPEQKGELISARMDQIRSRYCGAESVWAIPHRDEVRGDMTFVMTLIANLLTEKQAMISAIQQMQAALRQAATERATSTPPAIALPGSREFASVLRGGK